MVQLCYLLPSMARMDIDWNFTKLRQRLQVLMLCRQNHKKNIMVSAFRWNLLSYSSQLYKSILCMGKHTKYHRNIAPSKRLFSPVYTSPDKLLNGKNVHGSAFRFTRDSRNKANFWATNSSAMCNRIWTVPCKGVAQVENSVLFSKMYVLKRFWFVRLKR